MKYSLLFGLVLTALLVSRLIGAEDPAVSEESIHSVLMNHSVPLHGAGEALLVVEAHSHDFFLLGELHGEHEIPDLITALWPQLWKAGYRHVGAEVSPWAANNLEQAKRTNINPVLGLWTEDEIAIVRQFAKPQQHILWGCDIDEGQPERLILDMARLNPEDAKIQQMTAINVHGYNRKQAQQLLAIAEGDHPVHDVRPDGISLWQTIRATLRVEALRSNPGTKYRASEERELIMKQFFVTHSQQEPEGKTLLRFGRNHLHRGYDARGVSTLGNFIAEWALAKGETVFNVGVFAAGGEEHLAGSTFDADERQEELTFALLADIAGSSARLFDLRPLRPRLHSIASEKRTPLTTNLIYWTDTYDFLICYPTVSPLAKGNIGDFNQAVSWLP